MSHDPRRLRRALPGLVFCGLCAALGSGAQAATPWTGYAYADATGGTVGIDGVIDNGPRGDSDWDEAMGYYAPRAASGIHSALLADPWPPIGITVPVGAGDAAAKVWAGGGEIDLRAKVGNWGGPTAEYRAPGGAVYPPPPIFGTARAYGWVNQVHDVVSTTPDLEPGDPVQVRLSVDIQGEFHGWASVRGNAGATAMATVLRLDDYVGYLDGYDWLEVGHFEDGFGLPDYPNFWCNGCVSPLGQLLFMHAAAEGEAVDHSDTLTIEARIGDRILLEAAMSVVTSLVNEALDTEPEFIDGQIASVDFYDGYTFATHLVPITPGVEISRVPEPPEAVLACTALVTLLLALRLRPRNGRCYGHP